MPTTAAPDRAHGGHGRRRSSARRRPTGRTGRARRSRRTGPRTPGVGRRALVVLVLGPAALAVLVGPARPASASEPPPYRPPVDGVVVDPFRPPPGPYAAGNRGLEYATTPGATVVASGAGEVVFAGAVGATLHVTVLHPDGLRTSYSFLSQVLVARGQRVAAGQPIGVAGDHLHLGVRDPSGTYLDPALLFAGLLHPTVQLVPLDDLQPATERRALGGVVSAAARLGRIGIAVSPTLGTWQVAWATAVARDLPPALLDRAPCTSPEQPPPPPPPGRRILVLVGGLGSTSDSAAVDRIDAAALGYAPGDVIRFSYRGGRIPTDHPVAPGLAGIPVRAYDPADTQRDLRASGRSLRALLDQIAAAEPGVPVDLVAHSQGGVVTRLAVGGAPGDPPTAAPPALATVVTLSSPHEGADLATSLAALRAVPGGAHAVEALRLPLTPELDPGSPSIQELSGGSDLQQALAGRPLPPGPRVVSIGARGDLVVPSPRTDLAGAERTVVPLVGVSAHDALPGSPEAARELALALHGAPLSCRSLATRAVDVVVGDGIAAVEATPARRLGAAGG